MKYRIFQPTPTFLFDQMKEHTRKPLYTKNWNFKKIRSLLILDLKYPAHRGKRKDRIYPGEVRSLARAKRFAGTLRLFEGIVEH